MFYSSSINGFSLLDRQTEKLDCGSKRKTWILPSQKGSDVTLSDLTPAHTEHFHSFFFFFYTHSKTDMWAVKWTSMFKHGIRVGPHVELCGVGGFGSVPIMSDLTGVQSVLRRGENIPDVDVFISPSVSHLAEHRRRNVAANQRCWQSEAVKINVRWDFLQQ